MKQEIDMTKLTPEQVAEIVPTYYAYRYHDCIRLNHGGEVNGSKPIEAIPLYTSEQLAALLASHAALEAELKARELALEEISAMPYYPNVTADTMEGLRKRYNRAVYLADLALGKDALELF